jgi:hypothetical protein
MSKHAAAGFIFAPSSNANGKSAPAQGGRLGAAPAFAIAAGFALFINPVDAADRSRALRAEFQRSNPCPSTGLRSGACPGHQVDHREALICGGRDELQNLQWLSVEDHKAKTRVEVKLCRPRERSTPGGSVGYR